jgi:hypothetical protein
MSLDALRLVRNVLLRSFVIGIAVALVYLVLTLAAWNTWTGLAMAWWHTDEQHLSSLVINFFTTIRFYLVFILLVPALAIQWTIRSELKHGRT